MIDPYVMKFDTRKEQEEYLLFCIAVAGKESNSTSAALDRFLETLGYPERPLEVLSIINEDRLMEALVEARLSPYTKMASAYKEVGTRFWNKDFQTLDTNQLEDVKHIGPKTSRYFLMNVQPDFRGAALDTHIMKWLDKIGILVGRGGTPSSPSMYKAYEDIFLEEADKRGMTPAELDIAVWTAYKNGGEYDG